MICSRLAVVFVLAFAPVAEAGSRTEAASLPQTAMLDVAVSAATSSALDRLEQRAGGTSSIAGTIGKSAEEGRQNAMGKLRSLLQSVPMKVPDQSLPTDVLREEAGPIVGLAPAPSIEDVQFLKHQASEVQKYRESLEEEARGTSGKNCGDCAKHFKEAQAANDRDAAEGKEKDLEEQLKQAKAWAALETKREELLPSLVDSLRQSALDQRKLRVEAEAKSNDVQKRYETLRKTLGNSLGPLHKAVIRERFADRLRALEDARVALHSVRAADAAHRGLKLKSKNC